MNFKDMSEKEQADTLNEVKLLIKYLLFIYKKGKFPMLKVLGHPGTGKSGACIRIAELLNLRLHGELYFDPQYVVDNLQDLIEIIIKTKPEDKRVVVIEEMSALFNNRRFMGKENVSANKIFDTMRKKGIIVIGNYPVNKTVDSHIEQMFNIGCEIINLDKINKKYFMRAVILQTNPGTGKTYTHLFKTEDGFDVRFFNLRWCDEETFKTYDEGKDEFMDNLYKNLLAKQLSDKAKERKFLAEAISGTKPLTENQEHIMTELARGKTTEEIAKETNRVEGSIRSARALAFKKGYSVADFKKKLEDEKE